MQERHFFSDDDQALEEAPGDVKESPSLESFKIHLKKALSSQTILEVSDFLQEHSEAFPYFPCLPPPHLLWRRSGFSHVSGTVLPLLVRTNEVRGQSCALRAGHLLRCVFLFGNKKCLLDAFIQCPDLLALVS